MIICINYCIIFFQVNTYWTKERMLDLEGVVLVTVGGGRNDIQVPTSHTNTPHADIATTTSDASIFSFFRFFQRT